MIEGPMQRALSAWAFGVTAREVVFDSVHGIGARPSRPFCSMLLSSLPRGRHDVTLEVVPPPEPIDPEDPLGPDPDLTERVTTASELFVSMNMVQGPDTHEAMRRMRASLGATRWRDELKTGGMKFASVGEARDLSEIVKGDPEERHQADWIFNVADEYLSELYSIQQITIINTGRDSSVVVGG